MKLKSIYEQEMKKLGKEIVEAPWKSREFYAAWLAQTYFFVKDNTRLLMLCGSRMDLKDQKTHLRLIEHCSEEKGHEMLLVRDLAKLGYKSTDFNQFSSTQGLYQSQYYWIEHRHPMAFFGYIIMLEGLGAEYAPKVFKQVHEAYGSAASFLRVHGEEDTAHIQNAFKELEGLSGEVLAQVEENFKMSAELYGAMVRNCIEHSGAIQRAG